LLKLGSAAALLPLARIVAACGNTSTETDDDSGTTNADSATSTDGVADSAAEAGAFAIGSGAFLTGKDYGDPFANGIGTTCAVYESATAGPCHSNTYLRQEITDGLVGLPTRFELLVVDASCNPVADAIVEIWYCSPTGTYSQAAEEIDAGTGYEGSLSDLQVGFCTGNDSTALASKWLRAYQIAGADGRVTFDGIFPGWYHGRTTHVHFIITANGKKYVTSQLGFDETLTAAVYAQHSSYSGHGAKDTSNASDMVMTGISSPLMSFAQQSDGALVCWKAITIA
jgi:protocatechuate 3,4-dioxygenase beta subunit